MNETPAPNYAQETPPQAVNIALPSVLPRVTYAIIGVTIFVYLLQMASQFFFSGADYPAFMGMKINEAILAGQIWRLITPVLLHGSLLHIGFNMYALFAIGAGMESRMGHLRFLMLYLVSGFAGNVFSFYFTGANSLGASTAVFGLLAAEGVFLYLNKGLFGQRAQRALRNIVMVAGVNLFIGLSPGIDNWGHIGGLLGGLIFAWFGGPRWEVEGIYPLVQVVDHRNLRDAITGGLVVVGIFGVVAILKIF
ncbi:MAG: rhomboid family intramembrane serine protease [Anaerolineales bacterium]|uniref:Rhomboid family intramembrane serine protease n=1 Tax=Candidatus Desulfolinea nitratireducens TaxID=2841698 RepID=A0A8J6NI45_9CHLR|nr:rhomboid family intramembrane serine protease [Candidatus Desulfolinea nitratireducens]MBL6960773.1 rhomboid family intramembrane serine protease [Anaerolineales bacterium]